MKCIECGSTDIIRHGFYYNRNGEHRRYKCKDCGRVFIESIEKAKGMKE